jgi:hypothetical protein
MAKPVLSPTQRYSYRHSGHSSLNRTQPSARLERTTYNRQFRWRDPALSLYLYDTCLPFEAGIHLCPFALLEQMEGKLREFAVGRQGLVDAFLTAYSGLSQEAAKRLRSL